MIIIQDQNNMPMSGHGVTCLEFVEDLVISELGESLDVCFFDFEPEYYEWAFHSTDGSKYKNDYFSPLVDLPLDSDSAVFTLIKGSSETILNDNTYGTFYAKGSLEKTVNGKIFHTNKTGYKIDWKLVSGLLGNGNYKIKINGTNAGQSFEVFSHIFKVAEYTPEKADGTIRIESVHNGCVEGGMDYTDLDWCRSVRVFGRFGDPIPVYEENNFVTTRNEVVQITAEMPYEYGMVTDLIPYYIWQPLIQDKYLADELYISDYNILTPGKEIKMFENQILGSRSLFNRRKVRLKESPEMQHFERNTRSSFEATFIDEIQEPKKYI